MYVPSIGNLSRTEQEREIERERRVGTGEHTRKYKRKEEGEEGEPERVTAPPSAPPFGSVERGENDLRINSPRCS